MKQSKTILFTMLITASLSVFTACKKDDDSNNNQNTTKSLDKAKLVGKKWYNQSGTTVHDFRAGGQYYSGGTWEWKNNSDTMIIDLDGSGSVDPPVEWKFYWSDDHEMSCKMAGTVSDGVLFKDQPW